MPLLLQFLLCSLLCMVASLNAAEPVSVRLPGWIASVAFSPDGKLVGAACSDGTARLLDASTGMERLALKGHDDYVVAVAFSPDGRVLATGSFDRTARLWDLRAPGAPVVLKGHRGAVTSVAFNSGGDLLATGSIDGTVKLWSARTGKLRSTLRGHKSWVNSVTFGPDGATLLSGSSDGTIKLWDTRTGRLKTTLEATEAEVRSVAISADGQSVAAGIRYGTIKLWTNQREVLNFKGHESDVWSVLFIRDGTRLVSGDGDWNKPGQLKMWDVRTGNILEKLEHSGEVLSIASSSDGRKIAAGGWDRTLKIWPLQP